MAIELIKKATSIKYRHLSFFTANALSIYPEGTAFILVEDPAFWKVADGTKPLRDLRWYKSGGSGDPGQPGMANTMFTVWNYNTLLGMDFTTLAEPVHVGLILNNFRPENQNLFGRIFNVQEYFLLQRVGFNVTAYSPTPSGSFFRATVGVYALDTNLFTCSLITSSVITVTGTGLMISPTDIGVPLPSGNYMFTFHVDTNATGGSVNIASVRTSLYSYSVSPSISTNMYSTTVYLAGSAPAPATVPFPNINNVASGANLMPSLMILGKRFLKNV